MNKKRKIDFLGRFTIPKLVFDELEFQQFQEVEITVEYGKICLRKYDSMIDLEERPYLGIVRRLDEVHHIAIPVEYRSMLGLAENTRVHWEANYDEGVIRIWNTSEDYD